tara:strand:+ start:1083 stop:2021 length:939 start_codon:yes stop_codon:yes gene_type:complete
MSEELSQTQLHPGAIDPAHDAALIWALGTQGDEALLEGLGEPRRSLIAEGVAKIRKMPREQRIAFAGREARRLSSARLRRGLEGIDPSWLVDGLRGEDPYIVGAALSFLPTPIRRSVERRLPTKVRDAMPDRQRIAGMEKVWLVRIRELLDRRLIDLMPMLKRGTVVDLETVEAALRELGRAEAALGLQPLGRTVLANFIARLDPEKANRVRQAVKSARTSDPERGERAQRFWGRGVDGDASMEEIELRAGLWLLAHVLADEAWEEHLRAHFVYLPRGWVREVERLKELARPPEPGFALGLLQALGMEVGED